MADNEVIVMGDVEWVKVRYSELDEDELFWLQTTMNDWNSPMRKVDDSTALHLRDMKNVAVEPNQFVYQKEQ